MRAVKLFSKTFDNSFCPIHACLLDNSMPGHKRSWYFIDLKFIGLNNSSTALFNNLHAFHVKKAVTNECSMDVLKYAFLAP